MDTIDQVNAGIPTLAEARKAKEEAKEIRDAADREALTALVAALRPILPLRTHRKDDGNRDDYLSEINRKGLFDFHEAKVHDGDDCEDCEYCDVDVDGDHWTAEWHFSVSADAVLKHTTLSQIVERVAEAITRSIESEKKTTSAHDAACALAERVVGAVRGNDNHLTEGQDGNWPAASLTTGPAASQCAGPAHLQALRYDVPRLPRISPDRSPIARHGVAGRAGLPGCALVGTLAPHSMPPHLA